jgi:hypothetical protein
MPLNAEVEWAFGELAQRGLEEPTVMKTLAGTQSVVSVISAFDPVVGEMKFALKTFAQMYRAQGMVGNEFASLQSFHRALPDSGGIVSPEPLARSTISSPMDGSGNMRQLRSSSPGCGSSTRVSASRTATFNPQIC